MFEEFAARFASSVVNFYARSSSLHGICGLSGEQFLLVATFGRHECQISGGDGKVATPVPIPNTEVKHLCGDGTALERVWESSTLPGFS